MSQIFYSEIDANLRKELDARARAGIVDRSETALRYMTEKIANVSLTAYEGNKRDKTKIVHELGGTNVLKGEFLPGGDKGYLTDRTYTLAEARWAVPGIEGATTTFDPFDQKTILAPAERNIVTKTITNKSYRVPPFITQASLQINDNSKGTTNKATINITIPNADRDLEFMEAVYARPGRYCLLRIEHPNSALMTLNVNGVNGMLRPSTLPNRDIIKERYPEAEAEYDELRKMNKIQFEGVITSFEYTYNQDGTVTLTVYILGTSQTYTDLSMIMQTASTGSTSATGSNPGENVLDAASTFYNEIYKEVDADYQVYLATKKNLPENQIPDQYWAFGYVPDDISITSNYSSGGNYYWIVNYNSLSGQSNRYINLNYLCELINRKILSKLKDVVNNPRIICGNVGYDNYSNNLELLCSADPNNILLLSNRQQQFDTDSYGFMQIRYDFFESDPRYWLKYLSDGMKQTTFYNPDDLYKDDPKLARPANRTNFGVTGNILINLEVINTITKKFSNKKDEFTVKNFLKEISDVINQATGGAIALKLVTDPEDLTVMYFKDTNWIKDGSKPEPYVLPMFASDPRGSVVREFKLSAKLPAAVQSLMYSINSTDKVTESQLGPYISFMYNNGVPSRRGAEIDLGPSKLPVDELISYGGSKELTEKLAREYAETHDKYYNALIRAREEFGANPTSDEKRLALKSALTKYLQYPEPTIQKSNQIAAPTFPIEAEFTIDGINGLRYGDILDFPGLPAKYRTNTTFVIKGMTHSISTAGEWTTQVTCLMMPKFD